MILGLRTAIYAAPDLAKGRSWYARVLDRQPYFDEAFYVGFEVGGFELGLVPDATPSQAGTMVYWGVPDLDDEMERLHAMGATVHEPIRDVGGGIRLASILDPFGNLFGVIENPHYKAELSR